MSLFLLSHPYIIFYEMLCETREVFPSHSFSIPNFLSFSHSLPFPSRVCNTGYLWFKTTTQDNSTLTRDAWLTLHFSESNRSLFSDNLLHRCTKRNQNIHFAHFSNEISIEWSVQTGNLDCLLTKNVVSTRSTTRCSVTSSSWSSTVMATMSLFQPTSIH